MSNVLAKIQLCYDAVDRYALDAISITLLSGAPEVLLRGAPPARFVEDMSWGQWRRADGAGDRECRIGSTTIVGVVIRAVEYRAVESA